MRTLGLGAWVLVSCAAVAATGCGDDFPDQPAGGGGAGATGGTGGAGNTGTGGSGATGGSAGGSGGMGGSGGAATVPYEVTVFDFDNNLVEAAGVAIDLEDDTRVEGLTDATGVVMLELPADVDPDAIIAHKDGYSMVSLPFEVLGGTELDLFIGADPDLSGLVAVTGTASNMNDPVNDRLAVFASPGTFFNEVGQTAYDVLVPPSTDFRLLALDIETQITGQDFLRTFHSNVYSQQTGIAAPAVVDVDFANPTALSGTFTLSVTAPEDATLSSTGSLAIDVGSPMGPKGGSDLCVHDPVNDRFDCVGELWDSGAAADVVNYTVAEPAVHTGGYGRATFATVVGGPPSGLISPNFPNAPDVTAPTGAGPHPLDTVVEYSVAPGGGNYAFVLANVNAPDGRLIAITFADQAGEMRIPALPSSSDPNTLFEASMNMNFFTCTQGPTNQCIGVGSETWEASPPAN